jgi:hypothetical protein
MTAPDLTQLVDAVVADLETETDLPRHRVWRYVEPPVIRPDLGPMLAVFPTVSNYDLIATTNTYAQHDLLAVVWYAPTLDAVDTGGTGSQRAAQAALEIADTILARLRTYATGIPNLDGQEETTVRRVEFEMLPGGYWTAATFLDVTRWPAT